ncbi:vegetative cell wall protein gp1-like [Panicum virgatum]|uniref:vegetative cell wall protein gp1-like n=1 Tax=Panicum virgatum TaxID=38727 RepID=UPI0019D4F525|nr:vegetative cell wall protein gp1-like [Panicum virgatum]
MSRASTATGMHLAAGPSRLRLGHAPPPPRIPPQPSTPSAPPPARSSPWPIAAGSSRLRPTPPPTRAPPRPIAASTMAPLRRRPASLRGPSPPVRVAPSGEPLELPELEAAAAAALHACRPNVALTVREGPAVGGDADWRALAPGGGAGADSGERPRLGWRRRGGRE